MFRKLVLLVAALFMPLTAHPARAQEYFQPIRGTTLVLAPREEKMFSQGTGCLVDRALRLIVTNQHVVGNSETVNVYFPAFVNGKLVSDRKYYQEREPIGGKVVAADKRRDLAIVQVARVPGAAIELKLAGASPQPFTRFHLIGNPGKSDQLWLNLSGTVSRVQRANILAETGQKVTAKVIETVTQGSLQEGVSGGPLLNDEGELIGIAAAVKVEAPLTGIAIDVSELKFVLGKAYRTRGTALIQKRAYRQALAYFAKAIDMKPRDALAYHERGVAYSHMDNFEQAVADYTGALRLDPKLAGALRNRGSANFHLGKYDEAVADLSAAIRMNGKDARAYLLRSRAYSELGKAMEAEADSKKAAEIDPSVQ